MAQGHATLEGSCRDEERGGKRLSVVPGAQKVSCPQ